MFSVAPGRRAGTAADAGDEIAFLVGPDARWITGIALDIDGGAPQVSRPLTSRGAA